MTFTMPRPEGVTLLPGMTAQVRVELGANGTGGRMEIPTTALTSAPDGEFFVWVFDPASTRVSRRAVTLGEPRDSGVRIASGLTDGELIVAAGASQLQDGMQVRALGEPATRL
ncbi:MAG: hypothetical protein HC809_00660 [Gammaproteobacteria bacterium]|nr:hypothetical protein [Gammaproteobacteria bacterium]